MRIHVVVRGRVQGVGFRWFVREAGRELGLSGWVCNRPDGSVEVAAEGNSDLLDQLLDALRRGPSSAVVTSVDELDPLDEIHDHPFAITRQGR